jgi:cytoskeleton protein RodZ
MTKVTRLTLDHGGGLEQRRVHLREISDDSGSPLETVGQDLRTARQRKGEDLLAASRALKIRKDHLEALEEGNIQALPGRPYAIGFLRSYAEYLGLDPAQCIERFKVEIAGRDGMDDSVAQLAVQEERTMPHGSLIFLVLLVIAVVYGGYYLSVSANRMLSEPVTPVPDRLASEAGLAAKNQAAAGAPATASASPQSVQKTSVQPAAAAPVAVSSAPAPAPVNSQTAAVPPAQMPTSNANANANPAQLAALPSGRVYGAHNISRVELRVYRPTRILVQGPDNTVYINRALRAGDVFRAPNLVGLTLTTPDGGAIEIVLDGSSMGFAGKRGKITEGLSLDPQSIVDRHNGARSG